MKVTGNQLREALRRAVFRRDIWEKQFNDSLFAFKGEEKATPDEVVRNFEQADNQVAAIQDLQQQFNQQVTVPLEGREVTLSLAIKLVGGAGRREKMWRTAASGGEKDRYAGYNRSRNKDTEEATLRVPQAEALKLADRAARYASALREAIALGNSQSMDLDVPKGVLD
jgi:hypothetical protein